MQKISVVILDPYHFSVHFLKFLKNVYMSDYIYISKNLIYLQNSSLVLNKNVIHLMQSACYMMSFVKTLIKMKNTCAVFLDLKKSI